MIKRILIAVCAVLIYSTTIAQVTVGTPPAYYQPDSRRVIQHGIIAVDGLHTPSGGQPTLRSKVWPGAGLLFTDSLSHAFYYYSGGIFRNLADADCNGFIEIPQVSYQGTPFHFSISYSRYNIDCQRYNADSATVVIDEGDSLARKDVIYADTTGYHVKKGDPSETPARPTLLAGQLFITDVSVPAFDSLGTGINTIVVYDENTESTISNSGISSAVGNSTAAPHIGTYHTRITTINNGDYWEYTIPSGAWDVSNAQLFSFFMKPRAAGMPQLANLRASLWNGTTQVSQFEPTIGFNKTNITTYQGGSISMTAFGTLTNTNVTKVRFRYTNTTAATYTGFDFDYIHFITGIGQPSQSGGVSAVDIGITGNAISVTGPSTGAVNKTFAWLGNSSQYVDGQGVLRSYNALTTIGTFGSLASDAKGLGISGATVAAQPVTSAHPGMATSAMKAAWDSANARAVQNLGAYDTVAVYIDALNTGFKSLKDSTGIGIIDRGDYLVFYSLGGGGFFAPDQTSAGTTFHNAAGNDFTLDNVGNYNLNAVDQVYNASAGFTINSDSTRIVTDNFRNVSDSGGYYMMVMNKATGTVGKTWWPAPGGGSTPTLQQVITAGSTLTSSNDIALGSTTLTYKNGSDIVDQISAGASLRQSISGANIVSVNTYTNLSDPFGTGYLFTSETATKFSQLWIKNLSTHSEIDLTADTLKIDLQNNDNIVDISDSADYYLMAIQKGSGLRRVAKTHWIAAGGGGGSGTVNTGAVNRLAYYASAGTTVDDLAAITANSLLASDASGLPVAVSGVSDTEAGYLSNVTSDIQTQINGKQASDADLTTIAGLTATTDNFLISVSSAWASRTPAQARVTMLPSMAGNSLKVLRVNAGETDYEVATISAGGLTFQQAIAINALRIF